MGRKETLNSGMKACFQHKTLWEVVVDKNTSNWFENWFHPHWRNQNFKISQNMNFIFCNYTYIHGFFFSPLRNHNLSLKTALEPESPTAPLSNVFHLTAIENGQQKLTAYTPV